MQCFSLAPKTGREFLYNLTSNTICSKIYIRWMGKTRITTPVISYFFYYAATQIIPHLKEKWTRFKEEIGGD